MAQTDPDAAAMMAIAGALGQDARNWLTELKHGNMSPAASPDWWAEWHVTTRHHTQDG